MIIILSYYREYRTMQHIAFDYSFQKYNMRKYSMGKKTLVNSGVFSLSSKKQLHTNESIEVILIDATEVEIERPKKQKQYYFGKKKNHTLKVQIVSNAEKKI